MVEINSGVEFGYDRKLFIFLLQWGYSCDILDIRKVGKVMGRYVYTHHFLKRFDERFPDIILFDRLNRPYDYYRELDEIMDSSTIEKSFLNDTSLNGLSNYMRGHHIETDCRFEFLVNKEHRILFSCRPRGNQMVVVTCMTIGSDYFRRYFMPKVKYKKKERVSVELLELDRYGSL